MTKCLHWSLSTDSMSIHQLLLPQNYRDSRVPYFRGAGGPKRLTRLHGVAFLGIWGVVSTVLDMKEWDVNGSGCMGMTALTRASIKGHQLVAKMLLELGGINPDQANTEHS